MARCMTMAGVRPGMLIHNANGYGLFTGGLGFHQGGERLGATVVPVSGGFTTRQAMLLADLGAEVLVATPSYALVIAQALQDSGIDPLELPLELGLFGGEPWSEPVRGVNLYPSQIEHALLGVDGVAPHYRLIVERPGAMDELTLEFEVAGGADRESLRARVGRLLREQTGLRISVSVLDPGALPRSE